MDKSVEIEIQYFRRCLNSIEVLEMLREFAKEYNGNIIYRERLIETEKSAREFNFRGSPTILINGKDLEDLPAPENPGLTCRIYRNGLPTKERILAKIRKS